jgi:hypothetical protein
MKEIYEKHFIYLDNKKIKPDQIVSNIHFNLGLLEKLKNNSTITKAEESTKKTDLPKVNEEDEEDYYKYFDYENEDLNKLDNQELKKHKDNMEKDYSKNAVLPGDKEFVYNKEVEFKTDGLKSEWDEEDEEEF